jgi:uroporphyrinogen decarboxylase
LIDYPETREALALFLDIKGEKEGDFPLDDRILRRFGIDTRLVGGMPTPDTVHNREENGVLYNSYGIGYRMVNGHYEICHNPLTDCGIDEMIAYPMPEACDIDRALIKKWAENAEYLHRCTDYAIVAEHPVLGVFEIGCWMFGFDDYLYRMAAEPEIVHAFSNRVLGYQKEVIELYYGALGRYIDCTTSGDDFGMQTGPFMSVGMFSELVKPYFKERIDYTKKFTDAFYQHHTCGSVYDLIPELIDCGVDILNPIQPGVYMMEPERLKAEYGDKVAFWGGIDTQKILPRGSVEDVKKAVSGILSLMGDKGGYILSPAHCIQHDVPVANIAAIYDSV